MIFNANNLNSVLRNFGMGLPTGSIDDLSSHFEGGFFNRETFDKSFAPDMDATAKKNLGDALNFGFGKNSKNYTEEALTNAGNAYRRNGQVGLGTFATPTHSSSLLMETMDNSVVASAFGGAAIGGITGAAMGNDPGESAVYGGVAGAAMFGMGRGLRSGTFMREIEERAISSVLGKNYDELYQGKQAVYGKELEDIASKETYNQNLDVRAKTIDQYLERKKAGDLHHQADESYLQTHQATYGNSTEQQALDAVPHPEIYGEAYDNNGNFYFTGKAEHEQMIAGKAAAGEDVSGFYNSDGSLRTLEQNLEEDLAKTSKDYDADVEFNEAHLIDPIERQQAETEYANDLLQRGVEGQKDYDDYREQQKAEALKNDTDYQDYLKKEQQKYGSHLKTQRAKSDATYNDTYIDNLLNDSSLSKSNYAGNIHEKDLLAIRKGADTKASKAEKGLAKQARNNIRQRMFKQEAGEYEDSNGSTIRYTNLDELNEVRNREMDRDAEMYFTNHPEYDTKYEPRLEKKAEEINNRPLPESVFDRAKAYQIEDERRNFEGNQQLRELQNETLQKEIDANEAAFRFQGRLNDYDELQKRGKIDPFDISDEEIADRMASKGLDKVDDASYYRSSRGKDPSGMDPEELRKQVALDKRDQVFDEIKAEKQNAVYQAANDLRTRTAPGGDLEEIDYLGRDKFEEDFITNDPRRLQIETNKELTRQEGSFKSSFEKNKEDALKSKTDHLQRVKDTNSQLKKDVSQNQSEIKEDFKLARESQERISKREDPTQDARLMDVLKQAGAPDQPFATPSFDPKVPMPKGERIGDTSYILTPHSFNARQEELMGAREGGAIPQSFANKELLQEAVAAKPSSFMGKQAQKLLRSGPDHNIGMQTRHMVLGGSMLAGAAFGSKRKDHSRGFNSHRGNRI